MRTVSAMLIGFFLVVHSLLLGGAAIAAGIKTSDRSVSAETRYYISLLKKKSNSNAATITSGTTIRTLYIAQGTKIAYYENIAPENGHWQSAVLLFHGNKFVYGYGGWESYNCHVKGNLLRCDDGEGHQNPSVALRDLLNRKTVLLGGHIVNPYPQPKGVRFPTCPSVMRTIYPCEERW